MFELRQVTFAYPGGRTVLRDVNLRIAPGEFVLLRGPSGGGKSTLLRLLNGLEAPSSGEVLFRGGPLAGRDVPALRRRAVYLQQVPVMLDASVRDNLRLPFRFRSAGGAAPPADAVLEGHLRRFLLDGVSLEDGALRLSVGQKQRLALVRALLLRPEALLLDEPTASLDPESRAVVDERVEELNAEEGTTIVMATHTDHLPRRVRPRVLRLEDGALREVPA